MPAPGAPSEGLLWAVCPHADIHSRALGTDPWGSFSTRVRRVSPGVSALWRPEDTPVPTWVGTALAPSSWGEPLEGQLLGASLCLSNEGESPRDLTEYPHALHPNRPTTWPLKRGTNYMMELHPVFTPHLVRVPPSQRAQQHPPVSPVSGTFL